MSRLGVCMIALLLGLWLVTPVWAANPTTFTWTAPPSDATNAPASYTVKCGSAPGGPYARTGTVTAPTTTLAIAAVVTTPGEYWCVVTASNQAGESGPSNEVTFRLLVPPAPPAGLQVN